VEDDRKITLLNAKNTGLIIHESLSDQFLGLSAAIERLKDEFTHFREAIQTGEQKLSSSFRYS
jgi:hypothetical protein